MNENIDNETREAALASVANSAKVIRSGSESFHAAMEFVLKWEGGEKVTKDPDDPGGTTKWGISQRAYPSLNIEALDKQDAHSIYWTDYWRPFGLDAAPAGLALSIFDAAVNVGVGRVRGWFKELGEGFTAEQFNDRREKYYKDLVEARPVMGKYLKGWMNRLNDLRKKVQS
jgi:hypothetical protein